MCSFVFPYIQESPLNRLAIMDLFGVHGTRLPNLTELELRNMLFSSLDPALFPVQQITYLTFSGTVSIGPTGIYLAHMPQPRYRCLEENYQSKSLVSRENMEIISCPALVFVDCSTAKSGFILSWLFGCLSCPNLKSFSVSNAIILTGLLSDGLGLWDDIFRQVTHLRVAEMEQSYWSRWPEMST